MGEGFARRKRADHLAKAQRGERAAWLASQGNRAELRLGSVKGATAKESEHHTHEEIAKWALGESLHCRQLTAPPTQAWYETDERVPEVSEVMKISIFNGSPQ